MDTEQPKDDEVGVFSFGFHVCVTAGEWWSITTGKPENNHTVVPWIDLSDDFADDDNLLIAQGKCLGLYVYRRQMKDAVIALLEAIRFVAGREFFSLQADEKQNAQKSNVAH